MRGGSAAAGHHAEVAVADDAGLALPRVGATLRSTPLERVVGLVDEEPLDRHVAQQSGEVLELQLQAFGVGERPGDVGERRPPGRVLVGPAHHQGDAGPDGLLAGRGEVPGPDELGDGAAAELGSGEQRQVGGVLAVDELLAGQFVDGVLEDLFDDLGVFAPEGGFEGGHGAGAGVAGGGVGRVGRVGAVLVEPRRELVDALLPQREHPPVGQVQQRGLGVGDLVADAGVGGMHHHVDVAAGERAAQPGLVGAVEVRAQHPGRS